MLTPTRWRLRCPLFAVVAVAALVLAVGEVMADRWSADRRSAGEVDIDPGQRGARYYDGELDRCGPYKGVVTFPWGSTCWTLSRASMRITGVSQPSPSNGGAPSPAPTAGSSPTNSSAKTHKPLLKLAGLRPHHARWIWLCRSTSR